jgi:hypothetical protein
MMVQMSFFKSSKAHSLVSNEGAKTSNKTYKKNKGNKYLDWKKGPNPKSNEDTSKPPSRGKGGGGGEKGKSKRN